MNRQWHQFSDRAYGISTVETTNVLEDRELAGLAYGLLRYLDLDVAMAMSWAFTRTGRRTFEISQADLLRAMGHESLDTVSYAELTASYKRIQNTKIIVAEAGTDIKDAASWQIADHIGTNHERRDFAMTTVEVDLNRTWRDAITSHDWQAVDVDSYVHLARRYRKLGMARVIYLYLASWRNPAGGFRIPIAPFLERYAQRRTDGSYRYPDHFRNPQSIIYRSLRAVADAGVIEFQNIPEGVPENCANLTGVFKSCGRPWAGMVVQPLACNLPLVSGPSAEVIDGPSDSAKQENMDEHAKLQKESYPDSVRYCDQTMSVLANSMNPPLSRRCLVEAKNHGWASMDIWLVLGITLWLKANTEIIKTTAAQYAAGILKEGRGDPKYRESYQRKSVQDRIGIDAGELLRWLQRHHLKNHVMPLTKSKAAS